MADDTLLWDRKETRRQLGGVSDSFLDALVGKGYLSPLFRGRYLPDEVRACVASLQADRNRKSLEVRRENGNAEEGRAIDGLREDRAGAEGKAGAVREDGGGSRRKGKGSGGGVPATGYPSPSEYMARR